jgi:predicted regulator of Ras-like GTPase activity (Roadblock/LC7/MglB family)
MTAGEESVMTRNDGELDWLLEDLVGRVVGIRQAAVLSSDGLLMGGSAALSADDGDHLAAVASAFQSLARGASRHFGGGEVHQTVVEMDEVLLVVTSAGRGACLAVLAHGEADLGMIGYEMNLLVRQVGAYLSSEPRSPLAGLAADRRAT